MLTSNVWVTSVAFQFGKILPGDLAVFGKQLRVGLGGKRKPLVVRQVQVQDVQLAAGHAIQHIGAHTENFAGKQLEANLVRTGFRGSLELPVDAFPETPVDVLPGDSIIRCASRSR